MTQRIVVVVDVLDKDKVVLLVTGNPQRLLPAEKIGVRGVRLIPRTPEDFLAFVGSFQ